MSKTLNGAAASSKTFDIYSTEKDVVLLRDFAGDSDTLTYKRIAPKRVKDHPGMAKTELKLTEINPSTGDFVGIVTVTTSIRADATQAQKDELKALTKSALADAGWDELVNDQRLPITVAA